MGFSIFLPISSDLQKFSIKKTWLNTPTNLEKLSRFTKVAHKRKTMYITDSHGDSKPLNLETIKQKYIHKC